jgi:hypothetical protein
MCAEASYLTITVDKSHIISIGERPPIPFRSVCADT